MNTGWVLAGVGWLIAVIFGTFTVLNFVRSHYARVVLRRPEMVTIISEKSVEQYLRMDVFSLGADVYDLKLVLEAIYRQPDHPDHLMTARLQFEPETSLPNPLKKNQHMRFRLDREALVNYPFDPRDRSRQLKLTELPMGSVKLVAYQSGGRKVAELLGGDFEQALLHFDRAPQISVEKRGSETIATMRYPSGEVHQVTTGVRPA